MNFKAVIHLGDLGAQGSQIVCGSSDAIGFFHTQFLRMPNNCFAICQGACHREYWQLINKLGYFSALNHGSLERGACDLNDSTRFELIDFFNGLAYLRAHPKENTEDCRSRII